MQVLLLFVLNLSLLFPWSAVSKGGKATSAGSKASKIASVARGSKNILASSRFQHLITKSQLAFGEVGIFLESSSIIGKVDVGYDLGSKIDNIPINLTPESVDFSNVINVARNLEKHYSKSHIFVSEEIIYQNQAQLKIFKDNFSELSVVTENGDSFLIDFQTLNGKEILTTKISGGLEIEINQIFQLDDVIATLQQNINQSDLKLISLIDKSQFNKEIMSIEEIAKKNSLSYYSFNEVKSHNIKAIFSESQNKNVIIVGHVESKEFIVEGFGDKILGRYKIEELENLAKETNVGLILLGCGTSNVSKVTGLKSTLYLETLSKKLVEALNKNSYQDFLSTIGSQENPLIVRVNTVDEINNIGTIQIEQQRQIGESSVETAVVVGKNRFNIQIIRLSEKQRFERNVFISIFISAFFIFNFFVFRKTGWDEFVRTFNMIPTKFVPTLNSKIYKIYRNLLFLPYLQYYGLRRSTIYLLGWSIVAYIALMYVLIIGLFAKVDFSKIDLTEFYKIDEKLWNEIMRVLSKWWNKNDD
jgi:hypothetical protein